MSEGFRLEDLSDDEVAERLGKFDSEAVEHARAWVIARRHIAADGNVRAWQRQRGIHVAFGGIDYNDGLFSRRLYQGQHEQLDVIPVSGREILAMLLRQPRTRLRRLVEGTPVDSNDKS